MQCCSCAVCVRTSLGTVLLGFFSSGTRRVIFSFLVVPVNSSFRLRRNGTSTVRGGRWGRAPPPNLAPRVELYLGFGMRLTRLTALLDREAPGKGAMWLSQHPSLLQEEAAAQSTPAKPAAAAAAAKVGHLVLVLGHRVPKAAAPEHAACIIADTFH